ncbi:MAG: regulator, partial [Bacteroidota bacterium]
PYNQSIASYGGISFVGTLSGGVFRSTDDGTSWSPVNTGLTSLDARSLVLNSINIAFAGTGAGVFQSTNLGTTWTPMNTGLTNTDIRCLVMNDAE